LASTIFLSLAFDVFYGPPGQYDNGRFSRSIASASGNMRLF